MNIAGALVNPNGTTKYSWCPYLDTNAVFRISSSLIFISCYTDLKSILEKPPAPLT
jgi:hypothetical protein